MTNFRRDLAKVEATVIEKTVSHVKVHYTQKKRFRRLKRKYIARQISDVLVT